MVYCGKPSGACHACRERRTRCDKLPAGCTQCTNAKRLCPGYRALGDVLFRDVTTNVIRKAKAAEGRAKQAASRTAPPTPSAIDDDGDASQEGMELVAQSSPLQSFSLVPTVDERATGFFVSNYVYGLKGHTRGQLDYLTDVFRAESLDEGLISSMKAVGLAGFAHTTRSPYLMKNARYQYIKAIQHTNTALKSPATTKKDATLLTIIILGIFESIIGGEQSSLRDWVAHVLGASDVVKVRGHAGIASIPGRRMLFQVASNLLIACIQRADPVPAHIAELLYASMHTIRGNDGVGKIVTGEPAFAVLDAMMRFAQLRSDVVHLHETNPRVILARCLELDAVLVATATDPPDNYHIQTVFTDVPSDFIYNGRYHLYTDYIVAQIWNALRMVRFMLNEIVRDVLTTPSTLALAGPEFAAQRRSSLAAMFAIQDDILYSVPQHLGTVPEAGGVDVAPPARTVWTDFRERPDEARPLARISGALFLIWPLWFVGINDTASDAMRRFVVRNLRLVGDRMGIQQAYLLADAVESQIQIQVSL